MDKDTQSQQSTSAPQSAPVRYLFCNRPPFIGTHPDGALQYEAWQPTRQVNGRWFHGWVEYSAPLAFDKLWHYDLFPVDVVEQARYVIWNWAGRKQSDADDWLADYLEYCTYDSVDAEAKTGDYLCAAVITLVDAGVVRFKTSEAKSE